MQAGPYWLVCLVRLGVAVLAVLLPAEAQAARARVTGTFADLHLARLEDSAVRAQSGFLGGTPPVPARTVRVTVR